MEQVLWWLIATLVTALSASLGVVFLFAQRWQSRVERRLKGFHYQGSVLQWLVLVTTTTYRQVFKREPPPPPENED